MAGCASTALSVADATPRAVDECRLQLGGTPTTATARQRAQDALVARTALTSMAAGGSAFSQQSELRRIFDTMAAECDRAASAARDDGPAPAVIIKKVDQ
jgi:hypothetical protein